MTIQLILLISFLMGSDNITIIIRLQLITAFILFYILNREVFCFSPFGLPFLLKYDLLFEFFNNLLFTMMYLILFIVVNFHNLGLPLILLHFSLVGKQLEVLRSFYNSFTFC